MLIEELLVAWGEWSRKDVLPARPRCFIAAFCRRSARDADDSVELDDEACEQINEGLMVLRGNHQRIHDVLISRYLYNEYNDKAVAKRHGISESTVKDYRRRGHLFLEGWLCSCSQRSE
ncbi:antiterminator Q family protein [Dichelobacter nodosus]|uniref:Uncharacterized protein n=1 Tax=Dichelobacter nodosus (strain VCS1703A) TaxID=246195 RepID=A5EUW5_DICNV|nr:antiterminator Q family protein [Dichelobacter nodosus]ABQ14227.1 hypothetical protein DNO_0781 [Dichelobacter nodosus VCS1703A]